MGVVSTWVNAEQQDSKLSLRSTLVLWNIAASLIFVGVCWMVAAWLNSDSGRGKDFLDPATLERITIGVKRCPPEEIRGLLGRMPIPRGTSVALFTQEGKPELLRGEEVPSDTQGLALAWNGDSNHRMVFRRSFVLWLPVHSEERVEMVVGVSFPGMSAPPTAWRIVLVSLQAGVPATLVCLAVMIGVNRRLTRPLYQLIEATAHLGEQKLDYRVRIEGPAEFSRLAGAFNRMAAKLELTRDELTREKERIEAVEASRRGFLADISHNLGTPLSAIQAWVEQLARDPTLSSFDRQLLLNKIRRQVAFLSRTSGRLLDLSRWEYTTPEIFWEPFPIAEPLFEAVELVEDEALEKQMELRFECVGHHQVWADRARVRELFQIFLENAVHYAGRGATVEVSMEVRQGRLEVCVSDDGQGIPPEEIPLITQRFRCAPGGGNGLGLAIADQLVQALGGELVLESTPGLGTTVRFDLRLRS